MYGVNPSLLGASISRPKIVARHRGTCVDYGCQMVVDTMPETDARLVPLSEFLAGFVGRVDSVGATALDEQVRAFRAFSQVGRLSYDQANCDELATYAETGVAWSPQFIGGLLIASALVAMIWGSRN